LPPLGLDPALVGVVVDRAALAARALGFPPERTTVVLIAHGSTRDPASQIASEELARRLSERRRFADVLAVFLDQSPSLGDALSGRSTPVIVIGMFVGDGLHGREDVGRSVAALQRSEITFAGNVGTWPEIADLVAEAVEGQKSIPASRNEVTAPGT
jgi:sirohydrochlorin cobaltochelatase